MRRLGIEPGLSFDYDAADPAVRSALDRAVSDGLGSIKAKIPTLAKVVNGWQMITDSMGVYGTFYLKRAIISLVGLGANLPEDAVYPINLADADGKPLDGANRYVLHFEQAEIPPAEAFWSLTLYDAAGLSDRQRAEPVRHRRPRPASFNPDGSLDLLIQHESPGADREANWLPAPAGAVQRAVAALRAQGPGDRRTMGAASGAASGLTARGDTNMSARLLDGPAVAAAIREKVLPDVATSQPRPAGRPASGSCSSATTLRRKSTSATRSRRVPRPDCGSTSSGSLPPLASTSCSRSSRG